MVPVTAKHCVNRRFGRGRQPLRMGARLLGLGVHNLEAEEAVEQGEQLALSL